MVICFNQKLIDWGHFGVDVLPVIRCPHIYELIIQCHTLRITARITLGIGNGHIPRDGIAIPLPDHIPVPGFTVLVGQCLIFCRDTLLAGYRGVQCSAFSRAGRIGACHGAALIGFLDGFVDGACIAVRTDINRIHRS